MILDLSIQADQNKATVYFNKLIMEGSPIELKKIKRRTNKQNRYLHALFGLFGMEFGYSIEEAKILIKRELGYTYQKNGNFFLRHTSDMDTKELSIFIDKFRTYSAHQGCYLPSADEFDLNYVEILKQLNAYERYI